MYGGKRDKGVKPYRHMKGGGSIVRKALQQLEQAGLVEAVEGKGRRVTPQGQSVLDNVAYEIAKETGTFI
jgi:small subunit ribosomal protein S19e